MKAPQLLSAHAGHWTGRGTGVTVIVPPPGTIASGEVRGGAPATREFELLAPVRTVSQVDAVVLSGGSAFGLAAGDGVMRSLRAADRGFATPLGPVPIVVGMSIFDGSVASLGGLAAGFAGPVAGLGGSAEGFAGPAEGFAGSVAGAPPDSSAGAAALEAAWSGVPFATGAVGAGAGATTGKWRGRLDPGGVGVAQAAAGAATVVAVVVVNAWGDVLGADGRPLFGDAEAVTPANPFSSSPGGAVSGGAAPGGAASGGAAPGGAASGCAAPGGAALHAGAASAGAGSAVHSARANTTIGVLLTDALLDKTGCFLLAQSGHSGYARALHPSHSRYDGDAVVALATGAVPDADLDLLRAVAVTAMADAIRAAVIRA